jgi:nucleoside-diphosphate-sugar epimerase
VARVLIVPCGCRGRSLAAALRAEGHAVRGTTRGASVDPIRSVGAEPYVGDPDRIGTLMDALHGVAIVVWSTPPGLDTGRVRMLWEKLVDTGVRGVVHRGAGEEIARASSVTWQIPLEVIDGEDDGISAVSRLLGYTRS